MPSLCKRKISSAKVQLYYNVIIRIYLTVCRDVLTGRVINSGPNSTVVCAPHAILTLTGVLNLLSEMNVFSSPTSYYRDLREGTDWDTARGGTFKGSHDNASPLSRKVCRLLSVISLRNFHRSLTTLYRCKGSE